MLEITRETAGYVLTEIDRRRDGHKMEIPKVQFDAEKVIPATLIPGDGIGPEIVEATVMVLDAFRAPFAWEVHEAGMSGLEAFGDPLPETTLDSIRRTRLALKGPVTESRRTLSHAECRG